MEIRDAVEAVSMPDFFAGKFHIGGNPANISYMKSKIILRLRTDAEQFASLERLQALFAEACSALGPVVRETRCWNRVALHHLAYRNLREKFPALGSQMICNAIYSVSRSARLIFQGANSPWNIERRPDAPLPALRFAPNAPVYFDRHTLSLRQGKLSLYTLDGRLRFDVGLRSADEQRFREEKLKEVVLSRDAQGFFLVFSFGDAEDKKPVSPDLPQYVLIAEPEAEAVLAH